MFSIDLIEWPKSANSAIHFYLGFLVWVLDALKINFSAYENDPICTTKLFLDGVVSNDERLQESKLWWDYIDSREAMRDFQDKEILMARLAICLLSFTEKDVEYLGENLSWFLEVLGFLGENVDKAIEMMEVYFEPKS